MDTYGWKIKIWRFDSGNIESQKEKMKKWIIKWSYKYQIREIFVNNAFAVEYRLLLKG